MRPLLSFLIRLIAPLYSRLLSFLAYGPWGPFHQLFIFIFRAVYGIPKTRGSYKTLGDFFLRASRLEIDDSPLVSPAEGLLIEGPQSLLHSKSVRVKGLDYAWQEFRELADFDFSDARFWNIYLSPPNYHWLHLPTEAPSIEVLYEPGALYPVNALGRWLCPKLYVTNERMTFRWQHPRFGRVVMICVGAMGVSSFECPDIPTRLKPRTWLPLLGSGAGLPKAHQILGFRLGSSVLLIVEKYEAGELSTPSLPGQALRVGQRL